MTLPVASPGPSTPRHVPIRGAATASDFTMRMVQLLFNIDQRRRKTALEAWENEGGRVAADDAQEPLSINPESEAR